MEIKPRESRESGSWPEAPDVLLQLLVCGCCVFMGRADSEDLTAAQIFYPCMQCTDMFFLKAGICQLGMEQRKVNMLVREYCVDIKRKNKPIILSHCILICPATICLFLYCVFLLTIADICVSLIMVLDFQDSGSLPVCTKTQNSGSCEVYLRLRVNLILKLYA
ncbi:tyrosine--tRNA ligase 1, cytoplasmic-like isoform X2 [Triticum dicoccoides]|uniref:tyrosine--tRNA ligase 1, cytoplasmic-like isoform X2 n=1 Tax=Triticum dicoccoides TaxID=85692 RepID=UPI00188FF5B6|nr:tyrosine--tRNA ligase 1, cytoplasmic-like isoform X2 [Triticum dicoccoides]